MHSHISIDFREDYWSNYFGCTKVFSAKIQRYFDFGTKQLCSPLHFNPQERVFGCTSKFQSSEDNSEIVIFFCILCTL